MGNSYFTLRYVVTIGNFLFHIELYYCNRLNLYFTSNFVDIIEVSNWVTGEIDTIFFSLISSLPPMSIHFFFSYLNISLSPHMSSFFFLSQFFRVYLSFQVYKVWYADCFFCTCVILLLVKMLSWVCNTEV